MLEFFIRRPSLRIVFMGSPESAVPSLEYLVLNGFPVVAVYTRPDRPAGRGRTLLPPPVKLAAARFGGAAPVAGAILAGDEFTGVSTQLVLQKLDTGPVLSTAAVPISPRDNT